MEKTTLERGAGVLLPIYSLPSPWGIGTLGQEALDFVDFLKESSQKYWQVLPAGPTGLGDSPYQNFSAFAGNPYFIDLETLRKEGLLKKSNYETRDWGGHPGYVDYAHIYENRFKVLKIAFGNSEHKETEAYRKFEEENAFWLDDYALFMALKNYFEGQCWLDWQEDIRLHEEKAVAHYMKKLAFEIDYWKFIQFKFFEQWAKVKEYANKNGIEIIGDIPIYVALDSADTWVNYEQFQLDEGHNPLKVAGVPPDAFSADGQLWGNPLYDWDKMEKDDFSWWRARMKTAARLYDIVRIDHFIGIVRYYAIPGGAKNGMVGEFHWGPGKKLTDALTEAAAGVKIIAEDLGVIIDKVRELKAEAGFPGMKVLEFGFDSDNKNDYLPHNHEANSVVYAGTHDNETLAGWLGHIEGHTKQHLMDYLAIETEEEYGKTARDKVIRMAYSSICSVAILQMQDILGLGNEARTNAPSTIGLNWKWRLMPGQLTKKESEYLKKLTKLYRREPEKPVKEADPEKAAEKAVETVEKTETPAEK